MSLYDSEGHEGKNDAALKAQKVVQVGLDANGVPRQMGVTAAGAMSIEGSLIALTGGQSSKVSISSASAASAAFTVSMVIATPTADCFFRQGAAPEALADGTDQLLLANNTYRITGIVSGNKLAFITTGAAGTVYISPGA